MASLSGKRSLAYKSAVRSLTGRWDMERCFWSVPLLLVRALQTRQTMATKRYHSFSSFQLNCEVCLTRCEMAFELPAVSTLIDLRGRQARGRQANKKCRSGSAGRAGRQEEAQHFSAPQSRGPAELHATVMNCPWAARSVTKFKFNGKGQEISPKT